MARSIRFNEVVVEKVYNSLEEILEKHSSGLPQICNMDEAGLTTVQQAIKILEENGTK